MARTQLTLLTLFFVVAVAQDSYRITRINANPGLYFERLHSIRFRRADWRVAIVLEIQKFEHNFLQQYTDINLIYKRCLGLPVKLECNSLLRLPYLNSKIEEALEKQNEIKAIISARSKQYEDTPPRSIVRRSAPFGFIGTISRTLFGTLDTDDAEYYNKEIDNLYADQRKMVQLVRNQTHIVLSDLQNTHQAFNHLSATVENNRAAIQELVKILNEDTYLNYTIVLSQYASSLEHCLNHYLSEAQNFLSITLAAHDGILHPSLLNATKLQAIIIEIHNAVPQYEIPIPQDYQRIETIVKVARVTIEHKSGRTIIIVHIPLVNRIQYHIYQLHSLPILQPKLHNDTDIWASIFPQYPYLGLSSDHSTYFYATEAFLNSCKRAWNTYLCNPELPLLEVSLSESCEISLLIRPRQEILHHCDIKINYIQESVWHKLKHIQGWLYSTKETEVLQILCEKLQDHTVTIQGTGIMEINPDCIAKTRSTTLMGTQTFGNAEQYYYTPNLHLNISEIIPEFKQYPLRYTIDKSLSSRKITAGYSFKGLREIEDDLSNLETHTREKNWHYGLTYGTIATQAIIVIGIVTYYFWNLLQPIIAAKKRKLSHQESKPTSNEIESTNPPPIPTQRIIID